MNRLITLTYMILFNLLMTAQINIHGNIIDINDNAIPFATVSYANNMGTVSDSLGSFSLNISDINKTTNVVIRAMGYDNDTINLQSLANHHTFCLSKTHYALYEVAIISMQNIQNKSNVSTITSDKKEIKILRPRNVCGILQNKSGFTNKSGYQTPLTLRGMSGKHLLVLRNGIRRFSSYSAGYMSHTINVYDLERIEVEKGAASVMYGAGAMAGIINLIDKSPFKQNGLNMKITSGYGTINNEKNIHTCGGWSNGKLAVKTSFRYRDADNFKYPDGSTAENSFYSDRDLFSSIGYQLPKKQSIVYTADIHNGGPWGKPVGFNGSNYMRVQTTKENTNNHALKYTLQSSNKIKETKINLFYSDESRELVKKYYTAAGYMLSYVETTHFSDYYFGANGYSNIVINNNYYINAGLEAYSFHISTPVDAIDYIEAISFENRVSYDAHNVDFGVFTEHHLKLNDKIKSTVGLRYNYASINEGDVYDMNQTEAQEQQKQAFSGNIAINANIKNKSSLKLNLARSFRMPETTELYTDSYSSNGIIYGNPNLKPEYGNSFDIDYHYTNSHLKFEISPFIWLMNNMITKEEITGSPGTNYTYINIGKTRMYGGEANAKITFNNLLTLRDNFTIQCGIAYLNGTDVSDASNYMSNGTPLDYVPPFNIKSNISYNRIFNETVKCHFLLRTIYYSKQTRLGEDPFATPSSIQLGSNLGISLPNSTTKPSLNLVVNNLLNEEYYCYQSYLPSEGRDFRFFLTLTF